jgi:hypothetical protein
MVVELASFPVLGANKKRIALLMPWTLVDDTNDQINVRAVINIKTERHELRALIDALTNRAVQLDKPKEITDERRDA